MHAVLIVKAFNSQASITGVLKRPQDYFRLYKMCNRQFIRNEKINRIDNNTEEIWMEMDRTRLRKLTNDTISI